jgi:hypothetical protein
VNNPLWPAPTVASARWKPSASVLAISSIWAWACGRMVSRSANSPARRPLLMAPG